MSDQDRSYEQSNRGERVVANQGGPQYNNNGGTQNNSNGGTQHNNDGRQQNSGSGTQNNSFGGQQNNGPTISAGRDITGTVVVGDQHVMFAAEAIVVQQGTPPEPIRREKVDSRPRKPYAPIVGRAVLIGELRAAVQAGHPVQLYGPSGVGKSALLRHAARTLPPRPDGVVFLSAISNEIRDLAQQMFEACYKTVGYAPAEAELKKLMNGVRITAYVDNADFSGEQLRWLMDRAPDATFIFASREPTLRGEGTVLEVTGLDLTEGLDLLARESRRTLAEADRAAATDLWQKAQGRPLLLVQAAGLVRPGPSGEAFLPRPSAVAEITRLLLNTVDDVGQDVLWLLATLDGAEIAAAHVGALTGAADPAQVCDKLAGLGLLLADEDLYRCPSEAAPVIRDRHPKPFPPGQLCRHFTTWATSRTTAPGQVARHAAAIAQAARLAEEAGQPELAVKVARAASPSMGRALRFGPWGLVLGRGWSAAKASGDKRAEAYFTRAEGVRAHLMGRIISAALIGAGLEMLLEAGGLDHIALPAATPPTSLPVVGPHVPMVPSVPAAPVPASPAPLSAGSASVGPPVNTAPTAPVTSPVSPVSGGAATTGVPTAGGTPTTPVPKPVAGHAAAVASHMASLANSPVWPGTLPQVLPPMQVQPTAPVPSPPVPSASPGAPSAPVPPAPSGLPAVPLPPAGIGVLAKIAILIAVLGGMAAARAAITDILSSSGSSSSSSSGSSSLTNSGLSSLPSAPQPTGLAGDWQNISDDNTFTIAANGDGTYEFQDSCSVTVTLTGSGSTYSGQADLDPNTGGCGSIGYVTVTFTLDPGGQQMTEVVSMPPGQTDSNGDQLQCLSCGTFTLTRAPGS